MSGLEIAGVMLGAFPIMISGLENWHKASSIVEIFFYPDIERRLCLIDLQFEKIRYSRNLEALLIPVADGKQQVDEMLLSAESPHWKEAKLNDRLKLRLGDSYQNYMDIMSRMNSVAEGFQKKLGEVQMQIPGITGSAGASQRRQSGPSGFMEMMFGGRNTRSVRSRLRLSVGKSTRSDMFTQLKGCNERLEILLKTSDEISRLRKTGYGSSGHSAKRQPDLALSRVQADAFFKALQYAWKCRCQQRHVANLQLGHTTARTILFNLILMFAAPLTAGLAASWTWQGMQCGPVLPSVAPSAPSGNTDSSSSSSGQSSRQVSCAGPHKHVPCPRALAISNPPVQLCRQLSSTNCDDCMGVIGHEGNLFHLHPNTLLSNTVPHQCMTLDKALSANLTIARRQRISLAVALATAVAQLRLTPWLKYAMTKKDVYFFSLGPRPGDLGEPFIRQEVAPGQVPQLESDDSVINLNNLGIILLELCFGMRIEDHPARKLMPAGTPDEESAMDRIVAKKWVDDVFEESGSDYEQAVEWCLKNRVQGSWPHDFIANVLEPLELCKEYIWRE